MLACTCTQAASLIRPVRSKAGGIQGASSSQELPVQSMAVACVRLWSHQMTSVLEDMETCFDGGGMYMTRHRLLDAEALNGRFQLTVKKHSLTAACQHSWERCALALHLAMGGGGSRAMLRMQRHSALPADALHVWDAFTGGHP